jgi:hypothetical protein
MDRIQAQDSTEAIEQMWECSLSEDREDWIEALLPFDSITVAGTLLKLYENSSPGSPSLTEVVSAVTAMEAKRQDSGPQQDLPPIPDEGRDVFAREVDPWVKGWAVARYKHQDFRVFPQQRRGYDSHQLTNSGYRTYVWPDQEKMPPEDVERYVAEGAPLLTDDIFALVIEA